MISQSKNLLICLLTLLLSNQLSAMDIWGKGDVPRITNPEDVPRTLKAIWSGYEKNYDKYNPLEAVIHKTWEVDDGAIVVNWVALTVGHFQGQKTVVCGYWAYPKGAKKLPTIINLNGGPQTASEGGALRWARLGYACFHPNHNQEVEMQGEAAGLPNTNWGALNAVANNTGKLGPLNPSDQTIDAVPSPRNNWQFPRQMSGRRIISFLEKQPQVHKKKIGVRGHSTGGKWTVYMSIDPRVAATVPSVGGAGGEIEMHPILQGIARPLNWDEEWIELYLNTIDPKNYWPNMHAPVLHLGASNDFNAPDWKCIEAIRLAKVDKRYISCANYNHAFPPETMIADYLWFEDHLKGTFDFPKTPEAELILDDPDGIPRYRVTPPRTDLALKRIEVFYTDGRFPLKRYWTTVYPEQSKDGSWQVKVPALYDDEPLTVFANLIYEIDPIVVPRHPYDGLSEMALTTDYSVAWPDDLKAAGVKPQLKRNRMIDDFSKGLVDWNVSYHNPSAWSLNTRKISSSTFIGPMGAELVFEANSPKAGMHLGILISHRFLEQNSRQHTFYTFAELPEAGWNTIRLKPSDFQNPYGWKLDRWDKVAYIELMSAHNLKSQVTGHLAGAAKYISENWGNDDGRFTPTMGAVPDEVSGWDESYYKEAGDEYTKFNMVTKGDVLGLNRFRNMRWEGGSYEGMDKPYEFAEFPIPTRSVEP